MNMNIYEYCERHHACPAGRDWAVKSGARDMAEVWDLCQNPAWLLWMLSLKLRSLTRAL